MLPSLYMDLAQQFFHVDVDYTLLPKSIDTIGFITSSKTAKNGNWWVQVRDEEGVGLSARFSSLSMFSPSFAYNTKPFLNTPQGVVSPYTASLAPEFKSKKDPYTKLRTLDEHWSSIDLDEEIKHLCSLPPQKICILNHLDPCAMYDKGTIYLGQSDTTWVDNDQHSEVEIGIYLWHELGHAEEHYKKIPVRKAHDVLHKKWHLADVIAARIHTERPDVFNRYNPAVQHLMKTVQKYAKTKHNPFVNDNQTFLFYPESGKIEDVMKKS